VKLYYNFVFKKRLKDLMEKEIFKLYVILISKPRVTLIKCSETF